MSDPQIEIVRRWYATGHISTDDLAGLKVLYLEQIGAPPGCKTCSNVVADIKHHFTYQLKLLNLLTVSNSLRKFLILGAGFLMLPGQSKAVVNDGEESEDRTVLTDAMAEHILETYPDYSALIGINPAWQARQDVLAEDNEFDDPDKSTGTDAPDDQWELQAKYDALSEKYDALVKEHEQAKADHSVTKGQLTRAKNKLAELSTQSDQVTPVTTPATTPTIGGEPAATTPADDSAKTDVGHTEALEGMPSTAPASNEPKGNSAADAAQGVINQAQS